MNRVKNLYRHKLGGSLRWTTVEKKGQRAFTIVEVMVAATVMAFAISSSIVVLQQGLRAIDTARYTTLAGQILQSQMEKLRLLSWEQMTHATYGAINFNSFPADVATTPTAEIKRFVAGGVQARCSQLIVPADAPCNTTMLKITLTANWTGMDNRSHSLTYITYYGQYGLSDFFYTSR